MVIERERLQKLFQDQRLSFVPFTYIDDKIVLQNKPIGAYYFRKAVEANYNSGEENLNLVFKINEDKFKKIPLTVRVEEEKLFFSFLYKQYNVNEFQKKFKDEFGIRFDLYFFSDKEFLDADLLKLQKEIRQPLEILRTIFEEYPNEQFNYEAQGSNRREKYTLWKAPSGKDSYFLLLGQKSGETFKDSCRYQFTLIGDNKVEVSKFIYNKGMMWRVGRDTLPHNELVPILVNLVQIAQNKTKPLLDSIREKVESISCSIM